MELACDQCVYIWLVFLETARKATNPKLLSRLTKFYAPTSPLDLTFAIVHPNVMAFDYQTAGWAILDYTQRNWQTFPKDNPPLPEKAKWLVTTFEVKVYGKLVGRVQALKRGGPAEASDPNTLTNGTESIDADALDLDPIFVMVENGQQMLSMNNVLAMFWFAAMRLMKYKDTDLVKSHYPNLGIIIQLYMRASGHHFMMRVCDNEVAHSSSVGDFMAAVLATVSALSASRRWQDATSTLFGRQSHDALGFIRWWRQNPGDGVGERFDKNDNDVCIQGLRSPDPKEVF